MKTENALRIALTLSGKYDLPGTNTVTGYDMYGNPKTETVPMVDWERLEADLKVELAKIEE